LRRKNTQPAYREVKESRVCGGLPAATFETQEAKSVTAGSCKKPQELNALGAR